MEASKIAFLSALELAELVRNKEIRSVELTELYIDRIERLDSRINAVVVRDFDAAREAAKAADAALAKGEARGPLHGVPMTIKEQYHAAGLPTTFGYPALKDNVPAIIWSRWLSLSYSRTLLMVWGVRQSSLSH